MALQLPKPPKVQTFPEIFNLKGFISDICPVGPFSYMFLGDRWIVYPAKAVGGQWVWHEAFYSLLQKPELADQMPISGVTFMIFTNASLAEEQANKLRKRKS